MHRLLKITPAALLLTIGLALPGQASADAELVDMAVPGQSVPLPMIEIAIKHNGDMPTVIDDCDICTHLFNVEENKLVFKGRFASETSAFALVGPIGEAEVFGKTFPEFAAALMTELDKAENYALRLGSDNLEIVDPTALTADFARLRLGLSAAERKAVELSGELEKAGGVTDQLRILAAEHATAAAKAKAHLLHEQIMKQKARQGFEALCSKEGHSHAGEDGCPVKDVSWEEHWTAIDRRAGKPTWMKVEPGEIQVKADPQG